jgi:hypothetical protein
MLMLHIPKTGGTALRFLQHQTKQIPWQLANGHQMTLARSHDKQVMFVIRDPLERWCSGYWERATQPQRKIEHVKRDPGLLLGYGDMRRYETELLDLCRTPDQLLTHFRDHDQSYAKMPGCPLKDALDPVTRWLGRLENYRLHEHRVHLVFDMRDLTPAIKELTGLDMPTDPFFARTRALFDLEQSYDVSQENAAWFRTWRKDDYDVLDYIRTRPYYRTWS